MERAIIKNELEISWLFATIQIFLRIFCWLCNINGSNFLNRPNTVFAFQSGSIPMYIRTHDSISSTNQDFCGGK